MFVAKTHIKCRKIVEKRKIARNPVFIALAIEFFCHFKVLSGLFMHFSILRTLLWWIFGSMNDNFEIHSFRWILFRWIFVRWMFSISIFDEFSFDEFSFDGFLFDECSQYRFSMNFRSMNFRSMDFCSMNYRSTVYVSLPPLFLSQSGHTNFTLYSFICLWLLRRDILCRQLQFAWV
jgi:hypothetical protein